MLSAISQGDKDQYRMLTYGIKKHQLKKKKMRFVVIGIRELGDAGQEMPISSKKYERCNVHDDYN